jgi:hypothetical protein
MAKIALSYRVLKNGKHYFFIHKISPIFASLKEALRPVFANVNEPFK